MAPAMTNGSSIVNGNALRTGEANRVYVFLLKILSTLLCWLAFGLNESPAQTNAAASRWEPAIRAFERSDRVHPPPQNAVLFIGASAIRKWTSLAADFPGVPVINRGFGGSQIADSTAFAGRIIFPYHPRVIVLYGGDNDLAAGESPQQVVAEYTDFVRTVRAKLPETRIVFISIKPSPIRWKRLKDKVTETNRRIAAMKGNGLFFVDIFSRMLDADGNPRKDLFLRDGLHPNENGYRIWASLIRPDLDSDSSKAGK
jgi:lysophospholipase L1-like esterase